MTVDRPSFLIASDDGISALADSDELIRLSPSEAAQLGKSRSAKEKRSVAGLEHWLVTGSQIRFVAPLAMSVSMSGVSVHPQGLVHPVEVHADQLELLAEAYNGLDADEVTVGVLGKLLESGHFGLTADTGGSSDASVSGTVQAGGYLRPLGSEVDADDVGEPASAGLIPVYSVCASHIAGVPLGLGMLAASLKAYRDGALSNHFDFRPVRRETDTTLQEMHRNPTPSVVLFSNYTWSLEQNLELSSEVARICPGSLVIHGGPSTPRYEGDVRNFMAAHPEIDVLVNGEGEVTIVEVMRRLVDGLSAESLIGVDGTVVRGSDGAIHFSKPRERVADLSDLPSAYLGGYFDHLDGGLLDLMPLETNRGCPYGCAFCDWGSATLSRVRSFPMERVLAELDWIAEHRVATLFIADANFGMLPRDLEIANYISELHRTQGFPKAVLVSFAKNQTLRAAEIVKSWVAAGIATEGSVALQTTSEATLRNINRKNIKVERYDELTEEFRKLGLPLAVDLMLGLPGSTVDAFVDDLQKCIDGELTARIYPTVVLPNSPMNSPEYKEANRISVDAGGIVVSTSSFDEADYSEMLRLRRIYRAGDHFGLLRHVARWLQYDHGIAATTLYKQVDQVVSEHPDSVPNLHWLARHFAHVTVPPPSWAGMLDELRAVIVDRLGVSPGTDLECALAVQEAHLATPGAQFPRHLGLPHDYVSWFSSLRSGDDGSVHRPLAQYGPGTLTVRDPRGICGASVAAHMKLRPHPDVDSVMLNEFWIAADWELESPVMRMIPQVIMGS